MKKLIPIFLLFVLLLTSGFGCSAPDPNAVKAMTPVTLNYWRVWDGPDAFDEIIANYKKIHPNVTINYRKLRYDEYEGELLNALAEDRGPDIFSVHNTWIRKYQPKIAPMPASITLAYPVVKGTVKKEVVPEMKTTKSLTIKDIKTNFVDAVADDVIISQMDEKEKKIKEQIYGLPLSVDTLALLYNKDLLNSAGISQPPAFWNRDFQQDVKSLTKQDANGQIIQSGIALGGSINVERAPDILAALMMQNGAEMIQNSNSVFFNQVPQNFRNQNYNPGLEALRFYADFANPSKEVYSWNGKMENSLQMFGEGRLAMMLGYSYQLPTIRAQAPKLNLGIAKLPQIENNPPVDIANYWVETVSNKSKHQDVAWDFVQFETKAEQAKSYLDKAKKPTALRSLIDGQTDNEDIGVFAEQVLNAKSWYRGFDANAMEKIMDDMIDSVVAGQNKIEDIINLGARKVQQTLNPPVNPDNNQ